MSEQSAPPGRPHIEPLELTFPDRVIETLEKPPEGLVLVTGATGYVGGRLTPRLVAAGADVRVLVRTPDKLKDVPWAGAVDVVQGDLDNLSDVIRACEGVETMYFLVHSMGSSGSFEEHEAAMAHVVARAAAEAGVKRIVYLSGLHPENTELSTHMRSRVKVGEILMAHPVPAVVLQAGTVIGSGSASFEMIRHLGDRLPLMPAPSWVKNKIEPIAIRDVLYYLVHALDLPERTNRSFDIGSRDVMTYARAMQEYCEVAGRRRPLVFATPLPAPRLSGFWVGMVTPIPLGLAMPLVQSLRDDAVASERDIDRYIPPPPDGLVDYRHSVELALERIKADEVENDWSGTHDLISLNTASDPLPSDPEWAGRTVYVDEREATGPAAPGDVWKVIESIGGENGWYSWKPGWRVRGWMDKLASGPGLNRGRLSRSRLRVGDHVDWWVVEKIEPGHLLRLRAQMLAPGKAWLELRVEANDDGGSTYHQRAIFFPDGLPGQAYWYGVLPFHAFIFPTMARNILAKATTEHPDRPAPDATGLRERLRQLLP